MLSGVNVERRAIDGQEARHDKPGQSRESYFTWLCVNEQRPARKWTPWRSVSGGA